MPVPPVATVPKRSRTLARVAIVVTLLAAFSASVTGFVSGCSDPVPTPPPAPPTECGVPYVGDPNAPIELEIRALKADGSDVAVTEGSDLALIFPPQGGRVAFIGVRAKNLNPCGMQLLGAIRDPRSKQVRIDARTVNLQLTADGYGVTGTGNTDVSSDVAIAAYSNVPVCPNQWSAEATEGTDYEIEVKVTDVAGKKAGAKVRVIPRCAEPSREPQCKCLCKKGYVLGEACGEDAGIVEAGGQ